jgi:hypothetical protein
MCLKRPSSGGNNHRIIVAIVIIIIIALPQLPWNKSSPKEPSYNPISFNPQKSSRRYMFGPPF